MAMSLRALFTAAALALAAMPLATPAAATTLNQGDATTFDVVLASVPPEEIRFIDALLSFGDDGLLPGEAINLTLETAAGDLIFDSTVNGSDLSGGFDAVIGFQSVTIEEAVDPTLVTGTDYTLMLSAVTGSITLSTLELQFFGGEPAAGGAGDPDRPGGPFNRKPLVGITWETTLAPVPLPATAWLMLAGLGGLTVAARRRSQSATQHGQAGA